MNTVPWSADRMGGKTARTIAAIREAVERGEHVHLPSRAERTAVRRRPG